MAACSLSAQKAQQRISTNAGTPAEVTEAQKAVSHLPALLFGAAYYHEYEPPEMGDARLQQDIQLMKASGFTVVRMGESTWSLWEPQDGHFDYAWMDHIVDAMGHAGIKVILGTPTYSIPTWMAHSHPEVLAQPMLGGAKGYGMRQNMDERSPAFRFYAERLIRNLVQHYRDHPAVIGWQVDNETVPNGADNLDVFTGFVDHLKHKFGTTDALNKAWLLNYWGEDVNGWENMPERDFAISTGYKLEWSRWEQMGVTDYLSWQAALVREYGRPDQFVTQDFSGSMHLDVNEFAVAQALDVAGVNVYHGTQDDFNGERQALLGDFYRSLKGTNYLVTETNAQTTDWSSAGQFPPYDGQARLDVYSDLSSGANMVEYWHWASIHANQETYWKGVLGHDLEPNRVSREIGRTGQELARLSPHLLNLKIHNRVAILYSVDSANGMGAMPITQEGAHSEHNDYIRLVEQIHRELFHLNTGTDFLFAERANFDGYDLLIVPALYIADDALLQKISDYVHNGGHVLMTFKSGFANENSYVRPVRAPGPLRAAAGFTYQEFSNLHKPLPLRDDPFQAAAANTVSTWVEGLQLETAQALATYDHPFFGRWPAVTMNHYGKGTLMYEGTWPSDGLQRQILLRALTEAGLAGSDQQLPDAVRVKHGINAAGKHLHYYLNYSPAEQKVNYSYAPATDLLTQASVAHGASMAIAPWDLLILEER